MFSIFMNFLLATSNHLMWCWKHYKVINLYSNVCLTIKIEIPTPLQTLLVENALVRNIREAEKSAGLQNVQGVGKMRVELL